jgi:hypothetical protein
MLFPTLQFAAFFLIVYPLSWLLRSRDRAWKLLTLAASYLFYGAWDWRFVPHRPVDHGQHRAGAPDRPRDDNARRAALIARSASILALGTFKYYGFFIGS